MTGDCSVDTGTDLETELLRYLAEHPDAQDTRDGIVEWWFLDQGIRRAERRVGEALEQLVGEGLLHEVRAEGSPTQYRLDRDRLPQIRKRLEDQQVLRSDAAERRRSRDRKENS